MVAIDSPGEIVVVLSVVVLAIALMLRAMRDDPRSRLPVVGVVATGTVLALVMGRLVPHEAPPPAGAPGPSTALGYVSSSACRSCHPGEHASFARTYHRTMTTRATPDVVRAPLDGRALESGGRVARLTERAGEIWATLPDPDDARPDALAVERRVVLVTGSHREQAFWVAGRRPGDLRLVPFVWMIADQRFVAREDAFLRSPGSAMPSVHWASSCIACHAVAGEPRHNLANDTFDARVAELGIACEACHGPGRAHVDRHRDPIERLRQRASKEPDPTIVQPARLDPVRSAMVCGQCHAYAFPHDEAEWWSSGYAQSYRAGDALGASRWLVDPKTMGGDPNAPVLEMATADLFWPDGAVRVGGREYNGLVASPCYERGKGARKMTCLSCHAMHDGEPAGQIAPRARGDRACLACHEGKDGASHTHHPASSPGSACVACHMPKTSYALLSAVRTHRIDQPRRTLTAQPSACNLCHLDRTPRWTAEQLGAWYGGASPPLEGRRATTPTALHDGLAGDAAVRALIADALGAPEAATLIDRGYARAILEAMRDDPYAGVRFIAERSLRTVKGTGPAQPIAPSVLAELRAARDETPVTVAE